MTLADRIVSACSVELLDSMGGDLTIVNSARVSFAKKSDALTEKDRGLLRYLARKTHWTPFSQVQATLRIEAPIFIARQWFKSQIGVTRNEVSRRYVDEPPRYFVPYVLRVRPEGGIKQGSGGEHYDNSAWLRDLADQISWFDNLYENMIADGICPEQARMILPQCAMTQWIETGSLAYYARVVRLRRDPHAQKETQDLAALVADAVAPVAPVAWAELMGEHA